LPSALSACLPEGLDVVAAGVIARSTTSLQQAVTSCSWSIEVDGLHGDELRRAVGAVLAATELPLARERKGKALVDDIRPAIINIDVVGESTIEAELATQPRGLRVSELLAVLDPRVAERRVRRLHQWITLDGARHEPLAAVATPDRAGVS
jgi:hypothetical protein